MYFFVSPRRMIYSLDSTRIFYTRTRLNLATYSGNGRNERLNRDKTETRYKKKKGYMGIQLTRQLTPTSKKCKETRQRKVFHEKEK